jgi:phosphatidate cytidylyltransferase
MRDRLLLGPVVLLVVSASLAADEWVDHLELGEFARRLFFDRPTPPPGTVMLPVMVAISWFAAAELAAMLRDKGILASTWVVRLAVLVGLLVSCLVPSGLDATTSVAIVNSAAILVLVGSMFFYLTARSPQGVTAAAGGTLLAFVYLGLMFGFMLALRREHSAWVLLWVLLVIKSSDIGAYFTGKAIGRRKLIPWLSPGKTWEGLFGGIALAMAVGGAGLWLLGRGTGTGMALVWAGLGAGLVFAVLGQAGDLMKSAFKRDAGIKDSGKFPAFGGIIDMIDSPLLVVPVAFWWLRLVEPGV